MRVVLGVQRVDLGVTKLLVHVGHGSEVVNVGNAGARNSLGSDRHVADEARRTGLESTGLPLVVGSLRAEDDGGTLGDESFSGLRDVEDEGVDLLARDIRDADLCAASGTVGALVVVTGGGAAIVVAELDDDDVALLDHVDDLLEAALVGIRAGGATADGFVDGCDLQVFGNIVAPTVSHAVVGSVLGHCRVT